MAPFAIVDAGHARVKSRTPLFVQLCVPYTGRLAGSLRRELAAELRRRSREQQGGLRRVVPVVMQRHILVTIAGTTEATDYWVERGRIARLLADVVADVQRPDEARFRPAGRRRLPFPRRPAD